MMGGKERSRRTEVFINASAKAVTLQGRTCPQPHLDSVAVYISHRDTSPDSLRVVLKLMVEFLLEFCL